MTSIGSDRQSEQERESDAAKCEDVLRGLAFYLGVGGYNSDTFDADVFDRKIRDGIDMLVSPWEKDAVRYRKLRVRGVAPNGTRHFEERLALVATNLDAWVDALIKDGLGIAPSDAAEGIAEARRAAAIPDAGAEDVERVARAIYLQMFPERDAADWQAEAGREDGRLRTAYLECARAAFAVMPRRDERAGVLRAAETWEYKDFYGNWIEADKEYCQSKEKSEGWEIRLRTPEQPRDDGWQLCGHDSDCALHNEPAYPKGPCDCKLSKPMLIAGGTVEYTASDHGPFPFDGVAIASLEDGCDHWCSGQHDGGDVLHKPKYCRPLPPAPVTK